MKMEIIDQRSGYVFGVAKEFEGRFLAPIIANLLAKSQNGWDDYNEVYHCTGLIEKVKARPDITMDFHVMERDEDCLGIALVSRGEIGSEIFFADKKIIDEPLEASIVLNYFHVAPSGRGNGEKWLEKIMDYYQKKGFRFLFLKSSHPQAFSLYRRHGKPIGEYTGSSDNGLYQRTGRIFKILL